MRASAPSPPCRRRAPRRPKRESRRSSRAAAIPYTSRASSTGGRASVRSEVTSVVRALDAATEWEAVEALAVGEIQAIVSNTADRGYELDPADRLEDRIPRSFPAKLAKLLHARWRHRAEPVTLFPCELISRNGDVLRGVVSGVAASWGMEPAFRDWLDRRCIWACSLVDRIVSEALDPIGAVAEPYALWAIQDAPGLCPVCRHPRPGRDARPRPLRAPEAATSSTSATPGLPSAGSWSGARRTRRSWRR